MNKKEWPFNRSIIERLGWSYNDEFFFGFRFSKPGVGSIRSADVGFDCWKFDISEHSMNPKIELPEPDFSFDPCDDCKHEKFEEECCGTCDRLHDVMKGIVWLEKMFQEKINSIFSNNTDGN